MNDGMKSAWELALEKMDRDEELKVDTLTDEQREKIQEVRSRYQAKTAELEIHHKGKIQEALLAGDGDQARASNERLRQEKLKIEEKLEAELAKIREGRS